MGFWQDLFGGSQMPYPLAPTGEVSSPCGPGPFVPKESESFFNKLFMPKQIPYPLRPCATPPVATTVPPVVTRDGAALPSGTSSGSGSSASSSGGAPAGDAGADLRSRVPAGAVIGSGSGSSGAGASSQPPTSAAMNAPSPVTVVISLPEAVARTVAPDAGSATATPRDASASQGTAPASTVATSPATASPTAPVSSTVVTAPMTPTTPQATATPPASSATPVAPASPVSSSPSASATSGTTVVTRPVALPMLATAARRAKRLHAFAFNPEFTAQYRTAHEQLLETMIDEVISARMITRDSTPIVFTVPEGCDAFDLLYGPIEVNPGFGCPSDLDQIVTIGEATVTANVSGINRPLAPGDQLVVTVPWRAASWVELEAGRLRCQVVAQFFKSGQPVDACSTDARSAF
jgi:hypothetical protein